VPSSVYLGSSESDAFLVFLLVLGLLVGIGLALISIAETNRSLSKKRLAEPLTRECPHCKSQIRPDASVCPYCQRESSPWIFQAGNWSARGPTGELFYFNESKWTWEPAPSSDSHPDSGSAPT
jgi:hypothetical protein